MGGGDTPLDKPMMGRYKYKNKKTGEVIITNDVLSDPRFELEKELIKQKYGGNQSIYRRNKIGNLSK